MSNKETSTEESYDDQYALVTIVFHQYPQYVADRMYAEIEQVLEEHFNTEVTVDV